MRWSCSLFFIVVFLSGFGQDSTQTTARLKEHIAASYWEDKEKAVEAFFSISEKDATLSYLHGTTLLQLAKQDNQDSLAISIAYELGQSLIVWADFEKASHQFESLISYSEENALTEGVSYGYKGLGDVAQNLANYQKAIRYYEMAETGWKEAGNTKRLGYLYNNIGVCYRKQGNDYRSLTYYIEALELLKAVKDQRAVAFISNNIGNIYFDQGELEKALAYHDLVLKMGEELANDNLVATALNNKGLVLDKKGDKTKALNTFKAALQTAQAVTDKEATILSLTNLGESYLDHLKYDSARQYLEQALAQSISFNDRESQAFALIGLGKVHTALENYPIAKRYLEQGLEFAEQSAQSTNIISATQLLSEIEVVQGDLPKAMDYLRRFHLLNDSIRSIESQNNLELLKAEYEFKVEQEKSEAAIEFLAAQNEVKELQLSRRNLWLLIMVILFLSTFAIGYLIYHQRLVRKQKEANDLKQKLLRVQLNPHFMFNSLNAIQHLVYSNAEKQKTADYLARFSHLTRQILELNQHDYITLEDELKFIENYLTIQQIRFDQPFHYQIEVDDSLRDVSNILIPPMITQPFLENAIEHGIMVKNEQGEITLRLSVDANLLYITIEDNGVGRDLATFQKRTQKHRSLATQITLDRLDNLQRSFRRQASMDIEDIINAGLVLGTRVRFTIPLNLKE